MALLELHGLRKSFGDGPAVDGISLEAAAGEILCLLGPSGCGKTTLLRLIAGIEKPDEGNVAFNGTPLDSVPPQSRGFGLMFQDLALFSHMDVFGNVAFGLRMQRMPRADVRQRVSELLALVNMAGYGRRRVDELSGGERQRVALARALAPAPRLLMLDEPLGALDRALRDSLQGQIRAILKGVGVTSIYVTHDRDEALAVADRLAFIDGGRIVQTGTPEEVFRAPANEFVARTIGLSNVLLGVVRSSGESVEVECDVGILSATATNERAFRPSDSVMLIVDEAGIKVRVSGAQYSGAVNVLTGVVMDRTFRGGDYGLKLRVGDSELSASAGHGPDGAGIRPGDDVTVLIGPGAVRVIPLC